RRPRPRDGRDGYRGHRRRQPDGGLRTGQPRARLRGADRLTLLLSRHRGVRPERPRRARRAVERPARHRPLEHDISALVGTGSGPDVLITGAGGQLGAALAAEFPEARAFTRAEWDVTEAAADRFRGVGLVLHAASWTNVDGAEDDPQGAAAVNV